MQEAIGNALSPGAGRYYDKLWPDAASSSTGIALNVRSRNSTGTESGAAVGTTTGGSTAMRILDQCDVASLEVTALGGWAFYNLTGPCTIRLITSKLSGVPILANDMACYRFYVNLRTSIGAVDQLHDLGMQFTAIGGGSTGFLFKDGIPGWGMQILDVNTVAFVSKQITQPPVISPVTAAPFRTDVMHCYEFRMQSATPTADASLVFLIDGVPMPVPVNQSSWAAGTLLPPEGSPGGNGSFGWKTQIINFAGAIGVLSVQSFRAIAAPSVLACL